MRDCMYKPFPAYVNFVSRKLPIVAHCDAPSAHVGTKVNVRLLHHWGLYEDRQLHHRVPFQRDHPVVAVSIERRHRPPRRNSLGNPFACE